jgi:hypothetical protein
MLAAGPWGYAFASVHSKFGGQFISAAGLGFYILLAPFPLLSSNMAIGDHSCIPFL